MSHYSAIEISAFLATVFLWAGVGSSLSAAVALRPFLSYKGDLWTEKARLLYSVGRTIRANHILYALFSGVAGYIFGFRVAPLGFALLSLSASLVGTHLPQYWLVARLYPECKRPSSWFKEAIFSYLFRFGFVIFYLLLFLLLRFLLPWSFFAVAALCWFLSFALYLVGGWRLLLKFSGRLKPASVELQEIVAEVVRRMGVRQPRRIYQLRLFQPNAWAMPTHQTLYFSDKLLTLLDREEVAAIAAHEISHLQESPRAVIGRYLPSLLTVPLMLLLPLWLGDYLLLAIFLEFGLLFACSALSRRLSHSLEQAADAGARVHQSGDGIYARALEKIYRYSYVPACLPRRMQSHPDLYDRLIAAGVQPEYPRPSLPSKRSYQLSLLASYLFLLGGLFACFRWQAPGDVPSFDPGTLLSPLVPSTVSENAE
jgi:Zn-dependent protease with chaperone function